ncbi:MAG TPA: type I CRISPR-associated protein Cas7 [Saprospiraceae bacterium]|nr:type I CRISPR-associated protein Cas7 [Saprospiraceae bacterium]
MSNEFKNRVFGCAIIKSINSNYNADFSHQPRTLPDGTVYATDKALKYSVRNYWDKVSNEKVFYFKSLTEEMAPRTLDETLERHFGKIEDANKNNLRL